MENFVQLKKDNIFRVGIKDSNGNDTGNHLEFDLEDIELPLRLNQCEYEHRKNIEYLQNKFIVIDKRPDKKSKNILSVNEKEKLNVLKDFYKREMASLDLFLGEGGTKMLLNGRNPYYSMYDDISEILEPIMEKLGLRADDIKNKIIKKYSNKKEDNVLE